MHALPPGRHVDNAPSPQRWRMTRRIYCALCGLVMALGAWSLSPRDGAASAAAAAILGIMVWVLTLVAFRLSRTTSMGRVDALRRKVESAIAHDALPQIRPTGWSAFDDLGAAILNILKQRDQHIEILIGEVEYYRQLAEGSPGLEAYFNGHGALLWINPAVEAITGYSRDECINCDDLIELLVYAKDRASMRELGQRGLQGEARDDHELRFQRKDGAIIWFSCRWHPQRDSTGHIVGVRFSAQDIQRRKDVELKLLETVAAMRRAQALKEHYLNRSNDERMRLLSLLDTVTLGILFVDRDRRVVYISQPAVDMWKLGSRAEVVGMRDTALIEMTERLREDHFNYVQHLSEVIASREPSPPYDVYFTDGRVIREVSAIVPSSDGKRAIGRVWVYEDVTESIRAQRRLTELAERDPLTGLYNRRRFLEELDRQLADAARRQEQVGLLSFDLDGFKAINDTFGHQAGDEVLIALADEVGGVVRRNELFFRLGGDEFAVLVAHTDQERMAQLARRILAKVGSLQFEFDAMQANVTVSVGIAIAPIHAREPASLVAAADRAMYLAKSQGKNRSEVADFKGSPEKMYDWARDTED